MNIIKSLLNDRIPPVVKTNLELYGQLTVTKIEVHRSPVNTIPMKDIMNIVSLNGFDYFLQKYQYDDLFHLFIIIYAGNQRFIYEKNERIFFQPSDKKGEKVMNVALNKRFTINDIFTRTQNLMGSRWLKYDPFTNNCQFYINDTLKALGLLTPALSAFINQKANELFNELDKSGRLQSLMRKIVNIGKIKNVVMSGGGFC